jgi:ubiquitin C-terminal hydrolase
LSKNEFIVGKEISLADIILYRYLVNPIIIIFNRKEIIMNSIPNILKWFKGIMTTKEEKKIYASLSQVSPVGLRNLGFSCFANSCLQCFFHCENLIKEIMNNNFQIYNNKDGVVISAFLQTIENLYLSGINDLKTNKKYLCENNKYYLEIKNNVTSAPEFYNYILSKIPNVVKNGGSDPKIVAEIILSTMNKEIDSNFKYIRDKEIPKNDETLLFNHIFNYYENNKTVVSSNFYWIKEKVYICNECGKETYNFQSEYILYFYPEAIINGLNLKIDNNRNKYKLSLENCFEYFYISEQLDVNSFTCKLCNKRVKSKSILNYMATLPKYLVLCICKDKDQQNPINYKFDYNQEIDLAKYYKKHPQNNYSTKYKFHCGCFSGSDYYHMIAYCVHFDGNIYEFNDSFYYKYDDVSKYRNNYNNPYLLIYRRGDMNI